jgi:hypothetical protein
MYTLEQHHKEPPLNGPAGLYLYLREALLILYDKKICRKNMCKAKTLARTFLHKRTSNKKHL